MYICTVYWLWPVLQAVCKPFCQGRRKTITNFNQDISSYYPNQWTGSQRPLHTQLEKHLFPDPEILCFLYSKIITQPGDLWFGLLPARRPDPSLKASAITANIPFLPHALSVRVKDRDLLPKTIRALHTSDLLLLQAEDGNLPRQTTPSKNLKFTKENIISSCQNSDTYPIKSKRLCIILSVYTCSLDKEMRQMLPSFK